MSTNTNTKYIEATHSDGDGVIFIRVNKQDGSERHAALSKEQALFLLASLAKAVSEEFGDYKAKL